MDRCPEPGKILSFKNEKNTVRVPFTFVFDFDSFLEKIDEETDEEKVKTKHIQEHKPSAFGVHCISDNKRFQPELVVKVKTRPEEDMVKEFLDTITGWT